MMEKAQVNQMREKDERVRVITEILGGIKVLKLYAWENSFVKKIDFLRGREVGFLKKMQASKRKSAHDISADSDGEQCSIGFCPVYVCSIWRPRSSSSGAALPFSSHSSPSAPSCSSTR